jgi:hypothetical protein
VTLWLVMVELLQIALTILLLLFARDEHGVRAITGLELRFAMIGKHRRGPNSSRQHLPLYLDRCSISHRPQHTTAGDVC